MKKRILAAALGVTMLMGLSMVTPVWAAEETAVTGKMKVNGKGVMKVSPDMATISFTVESIHESEVTALEETAIKMASLKKALLAAGIVEKDISTNSVSLYPEYTYEENKDPVIHGYRASHYLNVIVRKMDTIGNMIEIGVGAGASQVNGVRLEISDASLVYNQALQGAIVDAKKKATAMAATLEVKLVAIEEISEQSYNYYVGTQAGSSAVMDQGEGMAYREKTEIEVRDLEISATVEIIYSFK